MQGLTGRLVIVVTGLLLGSQSAEVRAEWSTLGGNAQHTSYVSGSIDPVQLSQLWSTPLTSNVTGGMVVGGGGVFLRASSGQGPTIYAVDAATGDSLWNATPSGRVMPPAYADGKVYVHTTTELNAYDAANGDLIFSTPLPSQGQLYPNPTPFEGSVYLGGGMFGDLYSFNAATGAENWSFEPYFSLHSRWTPAVNSQHVFFHSTTTLQVLPGLLMMTDHSGEIVSIGVDEFADGSSSAVVLGPGNLAYTTGSGRVTAWSTIPTEEGSLAPLWIAEVGGFGTPSLANDMLYVRDGSGGILALDALSGTLQWSWDHANALAASMIVTDNLLFVTSDSSGGWPGETLAIDLATQSVVWQFPTGGEIALANNVLYILGVNDGVRTLYAFAVPESASIVTLAIGIACAAVFVRAQGSRLAPPGPSSSTNSNSA